MREQSTTGRAVEVEITYGSKLETMFAKSNEELPTVQRVQSVTDHKKKLLDLTYHQTHTIE